MRTSTVAAVAVLSLFASGCLEDQSDGTPPAVDASATDATSPAADPDGSVAEDTAEVPLWRVGDWWEYQILYSSGESYTAKVVVYSEDGGNYYITADHDELLRRAAFTHYPTLGAVRKPTLNHFIHGDEVPFFRFPMNDQTWEAPYRDFTAGFSSVRATLPTPKGDVSGFQTTMTNLADGNVRMVHGWSPETKYFTSFSWDFDGVAPTDVEFTLQDWGSNHTGSVPVLEITEGVHRFYPTLVVGAPGGAPPTPGPENTATFTVPDGSNLLVAMFAGAGGPGDFEIQINGAAGRTSNYPWRATAAGSHFEWDELLDFPAGECQIIGTGVAQNFAFLFLEAYAIKTIQVEI